MKLSCRLETIASFVHEGSRIADIGTDHGYIPIYLVHKNIAISGLAMDVRKGPLKRAETHIKEWGLDDKISVRISDGLMELRPDEADTVIIAGLGGELLMQIMEQGRHVWDGVEHWVLSPQSYIGEVRHFLAENGFLIVRESMVEEEYKYYTIMEAVHGSMIYEKESYYEYGKSLIVEKNPILKEFLQKERRKISRIVNSLKEQSTENAEKRLPEMVEKLQVIEEAYDEMQ
ncbi:MAG: class I SAM-dependent methyltransferase [Clostridium sp.]